MNFENVSLEKVEKAQDIVRAGYSAIAQGPRLPGDRPHP